MHSAALDARSEPYAVLKSEHNLYHDRLRGLHDLLTMSGSAKSRRLNDIQSYNSSPTDYARNPEKSTLNSSSAAKMRAYLTDKWHDVHQGDYSNSA